MAHSDEKTVDGYIDSLSPEKADVVKQIRTLMLKNLPEGIVETMNWGMISYEVPLSTYPDTYNKKPLSYAALAAQKQYFSLYLSSIYMDDKYLTMLLKEYAKISAKPNIGKSCIRFKKISDIPLKAIGEIVSDMSTEEFINQYELARNGGEK